jgi:hypothetical protein
LRRIALALLALVLVLTGGPVVAQQNANLRQAQQAYNDLDYSGAITAAQQALRESLSPEDRVAAYELLGFSYGAIDSTRRAVETFQQLIFLAPDREPDVERVSPRITSLYASALGQVLVVRRLRVDSARFVAGIGSVPIHFEVSRAAQAFTRVVGPGTDLIVDSQMVAGIARVDWSVSGRDGRPLPQGKYEIIVTAREAGRNEFASRPLAVHIEHGRVDTLPHLTSLPGYQQQPELVSPPRDWRPLVLTMLYTGLASGAFLALDRGELGHGPRTAMISIGGAALATGLVLSLRKPDPRPSPTNMLYNRLLRELLVRRNTEIAGENAGRRAQVLLSVRPVREE